MKVTCRRGISWLFHPRGVKVHAASECEERKLQRAAGEEVVGCRAARICGVITPGRRGWERGQYGGRGHAVEDGLCDCKHLRAQEDQ
jgi:hypothetical protein